MIFIPFIENAFKHSSNKKLPDAIRISIDCQPEATTLECINKYDPERPVAAEGNGLGEALIRKRLHLIYPDRHQLTISQQQGIYQVLLTIYTT